MNLSYAIDSAPIVEVDLGNIFQGANKTSKITITNDGDELQDLYVTTTDGDGKTTAKKTVLGGNEIAENVADSCVFGSIDGRSWYQLAGLNKKLLVTSALSNGESIDVYIKVNVPAGSRLSSQALSILFITD